MLFLFQVVYFTATFPYVILIALLIRGCTLPGAAEGLKFLFIPDFEKLLTLEPWRKAAEQMFFSLGISWGGLMVFGSYNKFNNRIDIDAAVVSSLDFFTSLIASCVIFSVLGELWLILPELSTKTKTRNADYAADSNLFPRECKHGPGLSKSGKPNYISTNSPFFRFPLH